MPNRGDLDGTGSATIAVNPGQARICFDIEVANIVAPARSHIRRAAAGANGRIVVTFAASFPNRVRRPPFASGRGGR